MAVKKKLLTSLFVGYILLAMAFIINNPALANGSKKGAPEDASSSHDVKWHPDMFYFVSPDLYLRFMLPYEPDQSGMYNLFCISKESGEILLLDTIKDNRRYITQFSYGSHYEVVLLYNNGKYVKHNYVIFENGTVVDMRNDRIQPSDSVSEYLKTMRPFGDESEDRASDSDDMSVSDFVIKGYVFSEVNGCTWGRTFVKSSGTNVKGKWCSNGGYFEIDVEDNTMQKIELSGDGHIFESINTTARCGLILVLNESRSAKVWRMSPHLTKARKL